MNTNKWLYFREVADTNDDDGVGANFNRGTSALIPASNLLSMYPGSDTKLVLSFSAIKHLEESNGYKGTNRHSSDSVTILINANTHEAVMESITEAITSPNGNSFINVADDCVTLQDDSTKAKEFINTNITSIDDINIHKTPQGNGIHEYYELVKLATDDSGNADNKSVGELKVKLPAQSILLEAAITVHQLSATNAGLVKLNYHTATTADGATAGTEWIGASASTSMPVSDLDVALTDGILYDTVHSGSFVSFHTSTTETFVTVVACEDFTQDSATTTTGIVGVYIKWCGGAAIPLA